MKKIYLISVLVLFVVHVLGQPKKITLEDIFVKRTFTQETVESLRPMNDGIHYTTIGDSTQIVKYSYKTGEKVGVLFGLAQIKETPIKAFEDYAFSQDETKILLLTNKKPIYRHSFTADYYVWNSLTEELLPLSEKGAQQAATFSPDGERVAFVRGNNVFIKNLKFGTESQVTTDGEKNKIINGIPDWVYEEEFSFNNAMAWSPDNKFLAFLRFDESEVLEFSMVMFAGEAPRHEDFSLYPGFKTFKYPKAGEKNSVVTVQIYDLKSKTTITADTGDEENQYIPRLRWTPDAHDLNIMRLNRGQDKIDILYANPYTGDSRIFYSEKNKRYISEEFLDGFTYLPDGGFTLLSERDGWSHLYLYDRQGFEQAQLTKGNFDVMAFYGYDPEKKLYYYQAAAESPLRREVYFCSSDGKKNGKLSTQKGTNSADFSTGCKYFINHYANAQTPLQVSLHDSKGSLIRVLENNAGLKNTLKEFGVPVKEFFTFKTSEGVELNGWMLKPGGFSASKKYPVVMTQYSGPNSQSVEDNFNVGWDEFLAQQGFLVVCIDSRGTAARGEDFRKITYLQLGKYESEDQVEGAKYLASLPYVDGENIGIWGWSYGGFMVALSMEKSDVFKAGISVAPVTNWRFYDTVYTERFMRAPNQNTDGYDDNSPLSHAAKLKGNLLLIHGSADDNVHFQNTMEFSEKLVQAGIPFDMAVYTNRNHGIRGGNTTLHLYNKMTEFLKEQLQ